MQTLNGARQSYDWGSKTSMFRFLGKEPDGESFAELWFGAHPLAPSTIDTATGAIGLDKAISLDQTAHLGDKVVDHFGRLPYLVKLLAPLRPLSIQVHPDPAFAAEGFQRENSLGIPTSHPQRSFKDKHHKPEMVFAITSFEGLAGFRPLREVALILEALGKPSSLAYEAACADPKGSLRTCLEHILDLNAEEIDQIIHTCRELAISYPHPIIKAACQTVDELSALYPGDVGAVVSLLLNRVKLLPGQLLYIADGEPHAYLGGFGLEVMANSDNVLRLGLTSKHVDVPSTLRALDFTSSGYKVETAPPEAVTHTFRPPVEEFALSISYPHRAFSDEVELPGTGPRILVCLQGSLNVWTQDHTEKRPLVQGGASFVGAHEGPVFVSGRGAIAEVFVP
ncbi:mannose-6-phosphate isomerase, class I [Paenarthrobacter sp. NPDC056912]|uniref:mannose-6-phosphate isomerase, class I n=1 Tax=Paenarthrobacter sp. NPDC056912 TaxID=3345965 RepID=UPI00366BE012